MRRRSLVLLSPLLPAVLAACSVLPDRPFIPTTRFPLAPSRPGGPTGPGRRVLLVRSFRAAPGLETRGLRTLRADGTLAVDFYAEWAAPPAEAAEDALRRWLIASRMFAGVTAAGSGVRNDFVLEAELIALRVDLARGEAIASISAILAQDQGLGGRVLGQFVANGSAPVTTSPEPSAELRAAAMVTALAGALTQLEAALRRFA